MGYCIYLVEDEAALNEILCMYLEQEGFVVKSFKNGRSALKEINNSEINLWILDIMLPDIDGIELLRNIKNKNENIPVIFMSARNSDIDRITGLELGSDDYISKPFLPRELVIRAKKILDRTYGDSKTKSETTISSYTIDLKKRIVKENDKTIELTSKEFELLLYFAQYPGQALSRQQIIDKVWGEDYFCSDRIVDNLIKRLRKKLENLQIETIYGYGYRSER
ncbi:MAG: response regulator transcription factor [Proteocatella sp.]